MFYDRIKIQYICFVYSNSGCIHHYGSDSLLLTYDVIKIRFMKKQENTKPVKYDCDSVRLNFLGGMGGDTFRTPTPLPTTFAFTHPFLRCFWKDPLMTPTPTTPLQASFTATPSQSTIPSPSYKFWSILIIHIMYYLFLCDVVKYFQICSCLHIL